MNALSHGNGIYLKLINDYTRFENGKLERLIDTISMYEGSNKALFFYDNNQFHYNETIITKNLEEFIAATGHWATWISNFGIYREDFIKLEEKSKFIEDSLDTLYWSLQEASKKESLIIFDRFYKVKSTKKRGYNFCEVFIENYLGFTEN